MATKSFIFRDYKIRPKGSPEISYDPEIVNQMFNELKQFAPNDRNERVRGAFVLLVKIALEVLPPKQREMFYSIWIRSNGQMSKGVMDYSRKRKKSHFTGYNNAYKAINSLKKYLKKAGYWEPILAYLHESEKESD